MTLKKVFFNKDFIFFGFVFKSLWEKYTQLLINNVSLILTQCVKKAVSNSLGLVDLAVRPVNFVLSLPDGQVRFFVHPGATMDAKSLGTLNTIQLLLTPSPPPSHTHIPPSPPSNVAYRTFERDRRAIKGIQKIAKVNLFAYLICYHC